MIGTNIHHFDLKLGEYALANVRAHMRKPAFKAYASSQIDAPVMNYMEALGGETDPEPLLLSDRELTDLSFAFESGPVEFDRPWEPVCPLHRRSIDCVHEIRSELTKENAEEWAQASAEFTEILERDDTHLSNGIKAVHDWIREARWLLRAMARWALLPHPEGTFPTPSCPEPPPMPPAPTILPERQNELNAKSITACSKKPRRSSVRSAICC